MIPIMMSNEIPLPTPLSVIRSPSHMMTRVEHTKINTALNHQNVVGFATAPGTPTTDVAR